MDKVMYSIWMLSLQCLWPKTICYLVDAIDFQKRSAIYFRTANWPKRMKLERPQLHKS